MNPDLQNQINEAVAKAVGPLQAQLAAFQRALQPLEAQQAAIEAQFGGTSLATVVGGIHKAVSTPGSQLMQPLDPISIQLIKGVIGYTTHILLKGTDAQTAANYTHFFVADQSYNVVGITEVHGTAGTDTGTVTLQVEKLSGTTAPGSGVNMLSTALNLKGTANTPQYGILKSAGSTTTGPATSIAKGDRIAWKTSGTLTALKDVLVTVILLPS